jgi:hypothetical protein
MVIPSLPTPAGSRDAAEGDSAGPLLGLVAKGLELWLRQQCQGVQELEIHLEGSMVQLLRGHLQAVRLQARQVVFQNLSLERVDLRSDPIQLKTGGLLRGQPLRLEHPFVVRGSVLLTGEGLSRSLATPEWQALGDHLCEELMGVSPMESVKLLDERLILRAHAPHGGGVLQVETRMQLTPSGLQVCPLDGRPPLPLEMDEGIRLELAEVRSGLMELKGEALVQP